ncbi:hypothetical protein [Arthrobacter sp. Y-9]|uniref:hypothetical protein n=1 Tax=Arthrobacter sp. Y-9 TaxID=3039385 RepID=UPI00241D9167|nr:hypothetical protein [Arthrobacter sp. Y-9]WFR82727.1 hypothetical protein P9849_09040 [Arthrobacter sp. Y-9]
MDTTDTAPALRPRTRTGLPDWAGFVLGVVCALVGLLPWLLQGMRLPLQNLWADEVSPDAMPLVALPFSQYSLVLLVSLIVTGSALAGLLLRSVGRPRRARGFVLAWAGLLLVQGAATAQTASAVRPGLSEDSRSDLYFGTILGVIIASIVVGLLVAVLVSRAPAPGAALGLTMGALVVDSWLSTLLYAQDGPFRIASPVPLLEWLPAVLVGAVLAWCGVRSVGRVLAWIVSLFLLWIVPALFTGIMTAAGSRVLLRNPRDALEAAGETFAAALGPAGMSWRYVLVALVIGAVGAVVAGVIRRRRRAA